MKAPDKIYLQHYYKPEASDYEGLLELPEGKAIEVEMRIKVIDK